MSDLAKIHDVEISFLGTFNQSNDFLVYFKGQIVCALDMNFLHDGVPQLQLNAVLDRKFLSQKLSEPAALFYHELEQTDQQKLLLKILQRPNIASKEFWVRQYDHEVQAKTIIKPLDGIEADAPMDAAVIKPNMKANKDW